MDVTYALNTKKRRRLLYVAAFFGATWGLIAPSTDAHAQDCYAEFGPHGYACVVENVTLDSVTQPSGVSNAEVQSGPLELPFDVHVFGESQSEVCVHAHGFLDFTCADADTPVEARDGAVWVYGLPMSVGQGSVTYGTLGEAPTRRFVVAWSHMSQFGANDGSITVQAVLYEGSNDIVLRHWSVADSADPVPVGMVSSVGAFLLSGEQPGPIWGGRGYRLSSHLFERPGMAPPQVSIDSPTVTVEGREVVMVANGFDPDLEEVSYAWDLDGDGVFDDAEGASATWRAGADGVVRTAVKATDGTWTIIRNAWVTVRNAPPVVQIAVPQRTYYEGQAIPFEAQSTDPGGDDVHFVWQWDDGSAEESVSASTVSHTYMDQGRFDVSVLAEDEDGGRTEHTIEIEVENVAPTLGAIGSSLTAAEGDVVNFSIEATDPGNDAVTIAWDFGDGTSAMGNNPLHRFVNNGTYIVRANGQDEDGGVAQPRATQLEVVNVAPSITSTPPTQALEYREYVYFLEATDPGDDTLTFELLNAPRGMMLTQNNVLTWRPDIDQSNRGTAFVMVRVDDGDGGEDVQFWDVSIDILDSDDDGMSDDCEVEFGFDPESGDDAGLDGDRDGLSNLEECSAGTDPGVFNGPTAPALFNPALGETLLTTMPVLVVAAAHDPDDDPLVYTFEIFADAELTEFVLWSDGVPQQHAAAAWAVPAALEENTTYWWRVRAADPYVLGPWSDVGHFTIDVVNESPSVPMSVFPQGDVEERQPVFVIDPSVDPEGDALAYTFSIFADADLTVRVTEGQTTQERWTPRAPLADNASYWWHVVAEDDRGAMSAPSPTREFIVNTANEVPAAPEIVAPKTGFESDSSEVIVEWGAVTDVDGDRVTYTVQVAKDSRFEEIVFDEEYAPSPVAETYTALVSDLEEDKDYHVRVRSADRYGASLFTRHVFSVNAVNSTPYTPVALAPASGAQVEPGTVELLARASGDPDRDAVTYIFKVVDGDNILVFEERDVVAGADGTVRTLFTVPESSAVYTWTVVALDDEGGMSAVASRTFSVLIATNKAPSAPLLLTPILGTKLDAKMNIMLSIGNAVDSDDDAIKYTFQVFADDDLIDIAWEVAGVAEEADGITSVKMGKNLEPGTFYWRAFATDAQGLRGASSNVERFEVLVVGTTDVGDIPSDGGCSTASGSAISGSTPFSTAPLAALALMLGAFAIRRRRR